jgi:methylase of polypeptide subunit release factors
VLAWCTARHPLLKRRYGRLVLEEIDGVPLLVLPEVFNPVLLHTGQFLARVLCTISLPPHATQVLDMGTGSRVGAVFAARRGVRVVAVDINPEAVRCARLNALLNRLEERIEVRHGDLMAGLDPQGGDTFDLVLFNPPFYRGQPQHNLDFAWRGQDIFERFAAGLPGVLKPQGWALLIFSNHGEWDAARDALESHGLHIQPLQQVHYVNEVITAYRVQPCSRSAAPVCL